MAAVPKMGTVVPNSGTEGEGAMKFKFRDGMFGVVAGSVMGLVVAVLVAAGPCGCGGEAPPDNGEVPPHEHDQEAYDFFAEHYSECVELCGYAGDVREGCEIGPVDADECVGDAWYMGYSPHECDKASECLVAMIEDGDCSFGDPLTNGGAPHLFSRGCP